MLNKIFLTALFLVLGQWAAAQAVDDKIQWVLPLSANKTPIGTPSPNEMPVQEGKQVYLQAIDGSKRPLPYDSLSHEHGPFWKVWKEGLQGIFHMERGEMIPPVYEQIGLVEKSPANWAFSVSKYGMSAVVNDRNRLMLPFQTFGYQDLVLIRDTILEYRTREVSYVSHKGNKVAEKVAYPQKQPAFLRISSSQYELAININGKVMRDTFAAAEQFVGNTAIARRDSLWGYLQKDGSWLIKPKFQSALPFNQLGYAVVKAKGKYGVVRRNGSYAIEPTYDFLKPFTDGLFEFKENGKIGLLDSLGKTILKPGEYKGFAVAGTECFTARSGDSLLVFRRNGALIPVNAITECSYKPQDAQFWAKQKFDPKAKHAPTGILSSDGQWRIPPVMTKPVIEGKYFFFTETVVQPCCKVGALNMGNNQPGKQLAFDRNGMPILMLPVDAITSSPDEPFVIYKLNEKYGLATSPGKGLPPDFDSIASMGNGWIYVKKGTESGALKWGN